MKKVLLVSALILVGLAVYAQKAVDRVALLNNLERYSASPANMLVAGPEWKVINVSGQSDFESMDSKLKSAIKSGSKQICINVSKGVYYFKDYQINLTDVKAADVVVRINGNGSTVIARGKDYRNNDSFDRELKPGTGYLSDTMGNVEFFSPIRQLTAQIEIVDKSKKLCRIPFDGPDSGAEGMKILLTEWFKSVTYDVAKVEKGYLYFIASDLSYNDYYKSESINIDFVFNAPTRYMVFNSVCDEVPYVRKSKVTLPSGVKSIHECTAALFLQVEKSNLKALSVEGLNFVGNSDYAPLFNLRNSTVGKTIVTGCSFKYIKGKTIGALNYNHLSFVGNVFASCYGDCISTDNKCADVLIQNNEFYDNGLNRLQHNCVFCQGENFRVVDNVFRNFTSTAVRAGVHYQASHSCPVKGVIEGNEIYYDADYLANVWRYTLIDTGAIYLATINDNTIVRYNYVHDYAGMGSNRGIYCDDGAKNCKIYGNVLANISSNAIDSRRCRGIDQYVKDANSGNVIMSNVIMGKYLFEGRDNGGCIHGCNAVLYTGDQPVMKIKDLDGMEEDIMQKITVSSGKFQLSRKQKKALKKLPAYNGMKRWL